MEYTQEEKQMIKKFIDKVKIESNYRKFLTIDTIQLMIRSFKGNYKKQSYPKEINNCLELALEFYKQFNDRYYKMITCGIENGKIIISEDVFKPYLDTTTNLSYIRLYGNDADLFLIVHELAHYVDRNSDPCIVPDKFYFFSETFSFYMEKQLELWLPQEKFHTLITARRNNRMFFESKMLKAIEYELFYENLFREKEKIEEQDISIKQIKFIMKYDVQNTINYLLQYPLANILSDHLLNLDFHLGSEDFCEKCLQGDLYEILKNWQ